MRYRLVVALISGTAFYGVLPVYLPPIVLQYEEVPYFLLGLCVSGVAGATLTLITGRSIVRGLGVAEAAAFAGTILHVFLYAIPAYGLSEGPAAVWPAVVITTFVYLGLPATIGAALAGAIVAIASRVR